MNQMYCLALLLLFLFPCCIREVHGTNWSTTFSADPTITDGNGDGFPDFILSNFTSYNQSNIAQTLPFPMSAVSNGWWNSSSYVLSTYPPMATDNYVSFSLNFYEYKASSQTPAGGFPQNSAAPSTGGTHIEFNAQFVCGTFYTLRFSTYYISNTNTQTVFVTTYNSTSLGPPSSPYNTVLYRMDSIPPGSIYVTAFINGNGIGGDVQSVVNGGETNVGGTITPAKDTGQRRSLSVYSLDGALGSFSDITYSFTSNVPTPSLSFPPSITPPYGYPTEFPITTITINGNTNTCDFLLLQISCLYGTVSLTPVGTTIPLPFAQTISYFQNLTNVNIAVDTLKYIPSPHYLASDVITVFVSNQGLKQYITNADLNSTSTINVIFTPSIVALWPLNTLNVIQNTLTPLNISISTQSSTTTITVRIATNTPNGKVIISGSWSGVNVINITNGIQLMGTVSNINAPFSQKNVFLLDDVLESGLISTTISDSSSHELNFTINYIVQPPPCIPQTCTSIGKNCGSNYNDGCGGKLTCGPPCCIPQNCTSIGKTCGSNYDDGCGGNFSCGSACCIPQNCTSQKLTCGSNYDDGCGGTFSCGSPCCIPQNCTSQKLTCGSNYDDGCGGSFSCGPACCVPQTCTSIGKSCGSNYDDGCGGKLTCGQECCTPQNCTSQNLTCGSNYDDGCGGTFSCGSTCCIPQTCISIGKTCGSNYDDGCGGTFSCGQECCTPQNCTSQNLTCGSNYDDGCGGSFSCGQKCCIPQNCTSQNLTCGSNYDDGCGGTFSCGSACCIPQTCTSQNLTCGSNYDDGCGGTFSCGQKCCIPQNCTSIGKTCGSNYDDGCGGTFSCGSACCVPQNCTSIGKTCGTNYDDGCGGNFSCGSACNPCGDGICNSTIGENCVTCPSDCGVGPCGVCGDGFCQSGIETCDACFSDCGACACDPPCSANGVCTQGICQCFDNFAGPQCNNTNQNVTLSTNQTSPTVNISSIFSSFTISVIEIRELNSSNGIVSSYPLQNVVFTLSNFTVNSTYLTIYGSAQEWEYQAHIGVIDIVIILTKFSNTTVVGFSGTNSTISAETLKVTLSVDNFPFTSIQNKMGIVFHQENDNNDQSPLSSCNKPQSSTSSDSDSDSQNIMWVAINGKNNSFLYAVFPRDIIIDGIIRSAEVISLPKDEVMVITPHFLSRVIVDPNYSVIVDPIFSPSENPCALEGSETSNSLKLTIIIVSCVIGGAAIAIAVIGNYILQTRKKRERRMVLERLKRISSHDDTELEPL